MTRRFTRLAEVGIVAILLATPHARALAQQRGGQPRQAIPPIGLDSTEDEIRRTVNAVRAGRKLTPKAWPNGARVAVGLSFDIDNELLFRNSPLPIPLSQGEYGATTGLPRILAMLDRQQVPATFYVPAVSAMLHPDMIPSIMKSGRHEIGVHGWIHEYLPNVGDAAREERLLAQAIEYLTKAVGKRPAGYRAPSWAFSPNTLSQILEAGFLYDSSFMAMDEPYELVQDGKPTGLTELPIEWILDDFPYYGDEASGSAPSPEAVLQIYKDEFDIAYQERTMVILTTHPHVSGHRSRVAQVDRLITYMKGKPGVWFATLEQIAGAVKAGAAR